MKKNQISAELTALKEAYEIAKIKAKMSDMLVADKYLTQHFTMIGKILSGQNVSRPVLHGVLRMISDTDQALIPPQYRKEAKIATMETVGEI